MRKHSRILTAAAAATLLASSPTIPNARADIFEWEYIDPADPSQGKQHDFSGDGAPDLAVASIWTDTLSVHLGNGNGTFQPAISYARASTPPRSSCARRCWATPISMAG